jgi:predicted DCC family thiol-disulfide oxidoreductase YuxK
MIANDPAGYFRFAASQSDAGIAALRDRGRDPATVESIVLIDDVGVHEHSNAALGIAAGLRFPWRALAVLRIVPVGLRDRVYAVVARNRYRWFGRRESCAIASPAERARFL